MSAPDVHLCTCGDCSVAPFDDRCRYELALRAPDDEIVDAAVRAALLEVRWPEGLDPELMVELPRNREPIVRALRAVAAALDAR
jgi:hypothetical protein